MIYSNFTSHKKSNLVLVATTAVLSCGFLARLQSNTIYYFDFTNKVTSDPFPFLANKTKYVI
jgi:hypothetical protein